MATAGVPLWSTTAASNGTADPAVNMAEGMAPSAVNDGVRALMASVAKWRDDITGSTAGLTTGGSSTAYTVTTNSTFATAAAMSGMFLTIIPHTNSGAAPTLAVDGLTARNINIATGVNVMTGALIAGTPYHVKYVHATTEFILVNSAGVSASSLLGNPTSSVANIQPITLASGLVFSGSTLAIGGLVPPQGRLTLTSNTPVLSTDVSAATTVYYTPFIGNLVPIYNGSAFASTAFTELSMAMSGANFAAGAIYDLFVINDSGTIRLGIGPVWSTLTAGSGARGTGAGTSELQLINGIWTNANSITIRYASSSTVSVAVNQATYVGSIHMDGTNSQISCLASYGQSRKWGIWNAYNQSEVIIQMGDGTSSWTIGNTTFAQSNSAAANTVESFTGLPISAIDIRFNQVVSGTGGVGTSSQPQIGIGVNATNAASGLAGSVIVGAAGGAYSAGGVAAASYVLAPTIGLNNLNSLQKASSGGGTHTASGGNANMLFTVRYRA